MVSIILAGGLGTRLSGVIDDIPKPMAPIGERPFLEILLDYLNDSGFEKVILSVGHKSKKIRDYFGKRYKNLNLIYSIEAKPLGTGGAIKQSLDLCDQDHAYVLNGDTFLDINYKDLESIWVKHKIPVMISRHVEDASRYGSLEIRNRLLMKFNEKKEIGPGLINAGCYILPKQVMNQFEYSQKFSFEEHCIEKICTNNKFLVFEHDGFFIDIGTPEDYQSAHQRLTPFLRDRF